MKLGAGVSSPETKLNMACSSAVGRLGASGLGAEGGGGGQVPVPNCICLEEAAAALRTGAGGALKAEGGSLVQVGGAALAAGPSGIASKGCDALAGICLKGGSLPRCSSDCG